MDFRRRRPRRHGPAHKKPRDQSKQAFYKHAHPDDSLSHYFPGSTENPDILWQAQYHAPKYHLEQEELEPPYGEFLDGRLIRFSTRCLAFPGLSAFGETAEEAEEKVRIGLETAIYEMIADRKEIPPYDGSKLGETPDPAPPRPEGWEPEGGEAPSP